MQENSGLRKSFQRSQSTDIPGGAEAEEKLPAIRGALLANAGVGILLILIIAALVAIGVWDMNHRAAHPLGLETPFTSGDAKSSEVGQPSIAANRMLC